MQTSIQEIVDEIPRGCIFDTHHIIACLIEEYSDCYLGFASGINADSDKTLAVHGKIGLLVATFEGSTIERMEHKSWSRNIHGKSSSCTCWRKL